jgi:hypothetical protein
MNVPRMNVPRMNVPMLPQWSPMYSSGSKIVRMLTHRKGNVFA